MKKIGILFFTATIICVSITNQEEQTKVIDFDKSIFNWTRVFAQVIDLAQKKHYKISDADKPMIKAISGFVSELDPHSNFLDPETYKMMLESTSGEFYGVGIVMDNTRKTKDKSLTVIDVIQDGPAQKAGILPYDAIVEIEGEPLEGMTTEKASSLLKGERHTKVTVKIMREGKADLLTFTITRDVVKEQSSLSFHITNQNIYYLSLSVFTENAVKQIESLLKKSLEKEYKGLILDLRNNSGGLLSAAVDIAGLFLQKNSLVVTTRDKHNAILETFSTRNEPIAQKTLPIFILINNYTASAGEILAGCLKMHSENITGSNNLMVFLVGTKTFGKGSVQEVIPIENNCALKLTTALYFLPNGRTIQGVGIEPDFAVERTLPLTDQMEWFTKHYGREDTYKNYIKVVENETEKEEKKNSDEQTDGEKKKRWEERVKDMLKKDNQLREAITLINMLHFLRKNMPELTTDRTLALHHLKQSYISNETLIIQEV